MKQGGDITPLNVLIVRLVLDYVSQQRSERVNFMYKSAGVPIGKFQWTYCAKYQDFGLFKGNEDLLPVHDAYVGVRNKEVVIIGQHIDDLILIRVYHNYVQVVNGSQSEFASVRKRIIEFINQGYYTIEYEHRVCRDILSRIQSATGRFARIPRHLVDRTTCAVRFNISEDERVYAIQEDDGFQLLYFSPVDKITVNIPAKLLSADLNCYIRNIYDKTFTNIGG